MRNSERLRRGLLAAGVLMCLVAAACYFRPLEVFSLVARAHLRLQGERSHTVVVAGNKIHYREIGSGTPLLLVHGLGGSSLNWASVMATFAHAGYHVYAPDLLGFGKSAQPDIAYTIADQSQMLRQFCADQHIQQADVIGWSMGGWVALQFTLENPTMVRRLVLDDSAGLNFHTNFTPTVFTPEDQQQVNVLFSLMEPDAKPLPNFVARDLIRQMKTRHGWVINRAMASMLTGKEVLDGKLGAIQQPVLINWGADDELIPLSVGYKFAKEIPQANLDIFSGCGHLAPARCSHAVADKTLQFLQAEKPPQGLVEQVAGH
jgi:pimeloyl-ACP methyl ester carboxylesterase